MMYFEDFQLALVEKSNSSLVTAALRSGFRTFLDPFSAEWADTSMKEKLAFVLLVENLGFNFEELIAAYKLFWESKGRPEIAAAADDALSSIEIHRGLIRAEKQID